MLDAEGIPPRNEPRRFNNKILKNGVQNSSKKKCYICGMEMRRATEADIQKIMVIMDSARAFQRSLGFNQWEDGYPDTDVIKHDISTRDAYVFCDDRTIVGYAFLPVGDDSYDWLTGVWKYPGEYGVIHRLAISPTMRGQGLSAKIFSLIETNFMGRGIKIIRVDTGTENTIMQRIMASNNYECRGTRNFSWGERLAYEKLLPAQSK